MALLKIKPTANGGGNYKGKLTLQISLKGTTQRAFVLITGIKTSDLTDWSEKHGKFIAPTDVAISDNATIATQLATLNTLNELGIYSTPKELKAAFESKAAESVQANAVPTFADWLAMFVKLERNKPTAKSTNYQLYSTLRNKLLGVDEKQIAKGIVQTFDAPTHNGKRIADTPVNEINTACFKSFCNWILNTLNGKGYKNLCTTFLAAINHAADYYTHLSFQSINYKNWRKAQPKNKKRETLLAEQRLTATANDIPVLTADEIKRFAAFDLSSIAHNGNTRNFKLLELYRDFALLVYYLGSRPADVMQLHSKRNYAKATQEIVYTPYKLRNRSNKTCVISLADNTATATLREMNSKALEIIAKYANQSNGGYLLPLPINETDWGVIDGDLYDKWEIRRKNTIQHVNTALQKIAAALGVSVDNLTLYTFRRSSITHQISGGCNWGDVAERSGTSVAMIEKHYRNAAKRN